MRGLAGGSAPKSTEQHKKSGTYRKDRHSRRVQTANQEPIGRAPSWLSKDEAKEFRALVKLKPAGFLSKDDTHGLATLAKLHVELAAGTFDWRHLAQLRLLWREFGMTPDSRYRMPGPPKPEKADPFDELEKRRKAQEAAA